MQTEYKPVQKDSVTENVIAECSEDFILPDYMPEIRRVLRLESRLLKGDSFVSGGKADFEGTVLYTLFYTDNEEKITAVPLESRYRYEVPVGTAVPIFVYSTECTEGVNMRPSGPRRLSIRTKIRATVHTVTEEPLQKNICELLPDGCGTVECLEKKASVTHTALCRSEITEALADFTLEGKNAEKLRPLYASADVLMERASAENGHILCRGITAIKVLLEDGDGIITLSRRVPFEDAMIADCREGDGVTANGICHAVSVALEQNGENVSIDVRAKCAFEALAHRSTEASVLCDAYATDKALSIAYKPLYTHAYKDGFMGNFTTETEYALGEGVSVPLCSVTVKDAQLSWEGKRAVVTGEARADLLCYGKEDGEEKEHFYAKDFSFPFRLETETPVGVLPSDRKSFTLTPSVTEMAVQNGKGYLSSEMILSLCAVQDEQYSVPDTITVQERAVNNPSRISIYYPTDKDSLWSVGKAYGIPTSLLAKQNDIPLDSDTAIDDKKTLDGMAWLFASKLS